MIITSFVESTTISNGWFGVLHSGQPTSYIRDKDPSSTQPFILRSIFLKEAGYQVTIPYLRPEYELTYSDESGLGSLLIKQCRIASWGNSPIDNATIIFLESSEDNLYLYFERSTEKPNIILLKSK